MIREAARSNPTAANIVGHSNCKKRSWGSYKRSKTQKHKRGFIQNSVLTFNKHRPRKQGAAAQVFFGVRYIYIYIWIKAWIVFFFSKLVVYFKWAKPYCSPSSTPSDCSALSHLSLCVEDMDLLSADCYDVGLDLQQDVSWLWTWCLLCAIVSFVHLRVNRLGLLCRIRGVNLSMCISKCACPQLCGVDSPLLFKLCIYRKIAKTTFLADKWLSLAVVSESWPALFCCV